MDVELLPCVICRTQPATFPTHLALKGCSINVWVTECDNIEYPEDLPFVEHNICVYGKDENQSHLRWNQLMRDLDPVIHTRYEHFK